MSKNTPLKSDLAAIESVEAAVHQMRERIVLCPMNLEIDDIVAGLEQGPASCAPRTIEAFRTAASIYAGYVERLGGSAATSRVALAGLSRILQVADEELFADVQRDDVAAAENVLASAEIAYLDARRELEAAFTAGDADAITRLRTDIEVTLPNAVGEARVAVKRRELELAESLAEHPTLRAARTRDALAMAQGDVVKAEALLEQAKVSADHWTDLHTQSESALRVRSAAIESATAAVDAANRDASTAASDRLANLMGAVQ